MDVTREDVLRCAKLKNLSLKEEEIEPLRRDMERLLTHAQSLEQLDLADVPATAHALDLALPLREDVVQPGLSHEEAMGNAPDQAKGHFRVPKVIDREM